MAKQNSGNERKRVRMSLSRPSRAKARATMSHTHTSAPATLPSLRKKLAVVSAGRKGRKYRMTELFIREGRLTWAAGNRLNARGTTTNGARRNNRQKILIRKLNRKTPARRISQMTPPAAAVFTPDGKRTWSGRMAETHSP